MQVHQYHVFSLPTELVDSLTLRNLVNRPPSRAPTPESVIPSIKLGVRTCNICQGINFLKLEDQRTHFRSDWHRYNVKTRLRGGQTVSEGAFAQLLDRLEDSLSGSASSDDDDGETDAVNALVDKAKHLTTRSQSPETAPRKLPVSALIWFHSPPSTQLGIYRAVLPLNTEPEAYLENLRTMQSTVPDGRKWAMFMVAGGHFAGAIVRVSRAEDEEEDRKSKLKKPKQETEVLLHKTFHRYTTRRKQGGSQSTNDNAKGPAKSAGALLRRYGEQALRDDIRGLLHAWNEEIAECERIWIRANTSNRRIFYDYEDAPWAKDDKRLRGFPFPTRRPTQSELTRCLIELTRPKVSHFTEEDLREQDEAYLASLPKPKPLPTVVERRVEKVKQPVLSKEEETLRERWSRLLEMVHKGRLDALKSFLDRESTSMGGIDAQIPEWAGEKQATIFQIAVALGHEEMTHWFLEEARVDPTIPVPSRNAVDDEDANNSEVEAAGVASKAGQRTAYNLATKKSIRDIFRRAAAAHPEWWDWFGAARVPSALSQGMEDDREEKKKAKRKVLKERIRERQARENEREKEPPQVHEVEEPVALVENATSRRLGGSSGATDGIAGLTPEMRAKVERERRARAAEARLKST